MSLIFSNVNSVTIPEGSVGGIYADNGATTLWKQGGGQETYTDLQYIQATGTQYIDTLYQAGNNPITVEVSASISALANAQSYVCWSTNFAMRISYASGRYYAYCKYLNSTYGNRSNYQVSIPRSQTTFKLQSGFYINGTRMCSPGNGPFGTNDSIKIFDEGMSGNIYSVDIYDAQNNLVMGLTPVERDSDGVAGLYDYDNDIFYASAGSNDFISGPPV